MRLELIIQFEELHVLGSLTTAASYLVAEYTNKGLEFHRLEPIALT